MGNLKFIESVEYSHEMDKMRRDRVEMSFYKYGSAKNNFGKGFVDALGSHDKCIERYKETKNKECLLDAMNCLSLCIQNLKMHILEQHQAKRAQESLGYQREKWRC